MLKFLQCDIGFFCLQLLCLGQLYFLQSYNVGEYTRFLVAPLFLVSCPVCFVCLLLIILHFSLKGFTIPSKFLHSQLYQLFFYLMFLNTVTVSSFWLFLFIVDFNDTYKPFLVFLGNVLYGIGHVYYFWCPPFCLQ